MVRKHQIRRLQETDLAMNGQIRLLTSTDLTFLVIRLPWTLFRLQEYRIMKEEKASLRAFDDDDADPDKPDPRLLRSGLSNTTWFAGFRRLYRVVKGYSAGFRRLSPALTVTLVPVYSRIPVCSV